VTTERRGPGLAKSRGAPLVDMRRMVVARATDARWRDLFESADTVSEGGLKNDGGGLVWFGSTSFVLHLRAADGAASRAFLAEIAGRDVHVRLRALRAARREASLRAPGPLGPATCEMRVAVESRGLRIDVDVQAPLIAGAGAIRPKDDTAHIDRGR
jgi:hypothetical protein